MKKEKYSYFIIAFTNFEEQQYERVNILKLDIKYEYGERFYTSEELKNLCKTYKVTVKDFLRNLGRNVKRYPYLRQALQKNEQGI